MANAIDRNSGIGDRFDKFVDAVQDKFEEIKDDVSSVFNQIFDSSDSQNSATSFAQSKVFDNTQVLQAGLQTATAPQDAKFDYNQIQGVKGNPNVTPEFIKGVEAMAGRLGAKPEHILAAMSFETGGTFSPAIQNGIKATGLIQFLPSTAEGLGTTVDKLKNMSSVEQLKYVEKYFEPFKGKLGSLEAVYTSILSGSPKSPDATLFKEGTKAYDQNPLDFNKDGKITAREATTIVGARMFGGVKAVQQKLVDLGFVPKDKQENFADSRWGTNTSNALGEFQKSRGLPQTGLMDEATGFAMFGGAPSVSTPTDTPKTDGSSQTGGATKGISDVGNLERGSRGDDVKVLQDALVKLGEMSKAEVDTGYGIFGPKTEQSVKDFQTKMNLPVTGKFDAATQDAMHDVFSGVSRTNQNTSITSAVQDALVAKGYMSKAEIGNARGTFGPKTEAALKRFQSDNKIQQTGKLGPMTYNSLFNSNTSSATPVNTNPNVGGNTSTDGKPTVSRSFSELKDPASNHYNMNVSNVGTIRMTEGFLVSGPHSAKSGVQAIMGDGTYRRVPDGSKVNLGIDYVVNDPKNRVRNWFGGEVADTINSNRGYGNRVIVKTDQTFKFNGKDYPVYTHYAHLDSIGVTKGQKINAGDFIGVMGNTGGSHGAHVDQRFWIDTPQGRIDLSPNLLVNRQ
ncbi:MAG: peptidoglycan-binding protein [Pyrinomonadaceae bacterium]|nr:peptidoglycan-binding protein [Pyrinomonadaceae bacterium]